MRRKTTVVAVCAALLAGLATTANARPAARAGDVGPVEAVTQFDPGAEEFPEGITISKSGTQYVTLGLPFFLPPGVGRIVEVAPDGERTTLAVLERAPAGIAVTPNGQVVVNWPSPDNPGNHGVHRLLDDGTLERLPGSEAIGLPNGLAFDRHGDVYVSDSIGAVWRMPVDGSEPAAPWLVHPLLGGCTATDIGANGVAFDGRTLYVANTYRGLLVAVPVQRDGSPGEPWIVAGDDSDDCEFDELFGLDGIALDVHGDVYAARVLVHELVRIRPTDGTVEVLATAADGLHNPASVAFGTGRGDRTSLFVTNYAVLPTTDPSLGPAVLRIDVGVPGRPVP